MNTKWNHFILAERSSTGLLEWDTKSDALEAIILCNHTPIPNPGIFIAIHSECRNMTLENSADNPKFVLGDQYS